MKRLNVMSGLLAFSFPCIVGAGIASPNSLKASKPDKVDIVEPAQVELVIPKDTIDFSTVCSTDSSVGKP